MNRILLREAVVEQMYDTLYAECDYPDVKDFARTIADERKAYVKKLEESLNKMYASFDPSGC
jgi:hypothetical protein